jgi:hypothetical protein
MELEEVKYIFLQLVNNEARPMSDADVSALLKSKTKSSVASISKSLLMEGIAALIFFIFPIYIYVSYPSVYFRSFAVLLFLLAATFLFRICVLLKMISDFQRLPSSVKEKLLALLAIFRRYQQMYLVSTMITVPVLFAAAFLMIYLSNQSKDPVLFDLSPSRAIFVYFFFSAIWCVMMYYFTRWYLKKLYGKYLQQLEKTLAELQSDA